MTEFNKYNLNGEQIEEITAKGIEYGAIENKPTVSPLATATEAIDFCIEAWGEGIGPDDEHPDVKLAGMQIMDLLRIAKVTT